MSTSKQQTESTVRGFFVHAQMLSVGGVFRNYERGKPLRPAEVAKLKTIKCGTKSMFSELLDKKQIGQGHPDGDAVEQKTEKTETIQK